MKLLVVLLFIIFVLESKSFLKNKKNELRKYRVKERMKYNNSIKNKK